MAGQVSVYSTRRITAHLRCTQCSNIANPDLLACNCRTWITLDIARFYEEQCQSSSGSSSAACQTQLIGHPLLWAGGVDTICTEVCQTNVTAHSLQSSTL